MARWQELETAVVKLLNSCNLKYIRIRNYRCFKCGQVQNAEARGFPDFHVPILGLYIECKTGSGRLKQAQKGWFLDIQANRHNYYILLQDNVDSLLQFLEEAGYIKT